MDDDEKRVTLERFAASLKFEDDDAVLSHLAANKKFNFIFTILGVLSSYGVIYELFGITNYFHIIMLILSILITAKFHCAISDMGRIIRDEINSRML